MRGEAGRNKLELVASAKLLVGPQPEITRSRSKRPKHGDNESPDNMSSKSLDSRVERVFPATLSIRELLDTYPTPWMKSAR